MVPLDRPAAQIFFATLFAVGIRWVRLHRRYDVLSVGAVNYIVAFACGIVTMLAARGATSELRMGSALLTGGALG